MGNISVPGATMHEAQAHASGLRSRRLMRIERRLRRHQHGLRADELTNWYAIRATLRDRGVTVPPRTARPVGLP